MSERARAEELSATAVCFRLPEPSEMEPALFLDAADLERATVGCYLISGLSPVSIGILRDLSGGFLLPMLILAAIGAGSGIGLTAALRSPLPSGRRVAAAGAPTHQQREGVAG